MAILDLLLNLLGLLLWFGWRALGLDQRAKPRPLSLVSTLKRAAPRPGRAWPILTALGGLLLLRGLLYWYWGVRADWVPRMSLGVISIRVPVNTWDSALLFSLASFFRVWVVAHVGVLLIVLLNRRTPTAGSFQLFLHAQWGRLVRWPAWLLVTLTLVAGAALWLGLRPPLLRLGLTSAAPAGVGLAQEALGFGMSLFLIWEYTALLVLLIHFVNTYVYVGRIGWWRCLATAGNNLVRWLPLHLGRLDLAPLAGAGLVFGLGYGLTWLVEVLFTQPIL